MKLMISATVEQLTKETCFTISLCYPRIPEISGTTGITKVSHGPGIPRPRESRNLKDQREHRVTGVPRDSRAQKNHRDTPLGSQGTPRTLAISGTQRSQSYLAPRDPLCRYRDLMFLGSPGTSGTLWTPETTGILRQPYVPGIPRDSRDLNTPM